MDKQNKTKIKGVNRRSKRKKEEDLGVIIGENGKQDMEINRRIENNLKIYHAVNKTFFSRKEISKRRK